MSLLLVQGDARHLPFADGSVQTCITSPPYWGLRDYGTATWVGGDAACDHRMKNPEVDQRTSTLGHNRTGLDITNAAYQHGHTFKSACGKCGAVRVDAQLGLEPTPDAYVQGMVAVFREVWRVLREDGTCWIVIGDSYCNTDKWGGGGPNTGKQTIAADGSVPSWNVRARREPFGLKPKDLVGIPWRVAFALQADGWYLRSDIIWSKPNPMPESVTDRPTKSHEYVFLLSKAQSYYFDADAVREAGAGRMDLGRMTSPARLNQGGEWANTQKAVADGRNIRSVWHIATQPYGGCHFATFPEKLVERCVLAGSKPGDVVLDPFMGSGTVARVALKLGRKAIGCDLNPAYLKLADDRTRVTYGLPLEVA